MARLPNPSQAPLPRRPSGKLIPKRQKFDWGIAVNDAVADNFHGGSRVFPARFAGTCPCGDKYESGDRIHFTPGGRLAHEGCDGTETPAVNAAEEAMGMGAKEVAAARSRMCPECFQIRTPAGRCGCDG